MAAQPAEKDETKPEEKAAGRPSGGIKAWLPLILTIVVTPALAYAMTTYVLIPKLKNSLGVQTVQARETNDEHNASAAEKAPAKENGKPKLKVPLSKVVVNVSGSLGTRLLLASFTLAGSAGDF